MMGEATEENPPFDVIVVCKLKNFSWSLDETVLCRDRLKANGISLLSTAEISMQSRSHRHRGPGTRKPPDTSKEAPRPWK